MLWLFGDSHIDDYAPATKTTPCLFQVRNAAMLQKTSDLEHAETLIGKGAGFRSLFKNSTNEDYWFWPGAGFQEARTVYVYLSALRKTAQGGQWGFESAGHDYWAKMSFPEMKVVGYMALPDFNGINFGCGFIKDIESGYTYAFGNKRDFIESTVYVARFRSDNPDKDWVFWDGATWNADPAKAAVVTRAPSTSVNVCRIKNKYVLISSAFSVGCDQGKEIYALTSSNATGPFSPRKAIFAVDDIWQGHHPFFYLPVSHPELINQKHELLITYSINGYEPCISSCVRGRAIPDHYRPKAIRVPLKLIDLQF